MKNSISFVFLHMQFIKIKHSNTLKENYDQRFSIFFKLLLEQLGELSIKFSSLNTLTK